MTGFYTVLQFNSKIQNKKFLKRAEVRKKHDENIERIGLSENFQISLCRFVNDVLQN